VKSKRRPQSTITTAITGATSSSTVYAASTEVSLGLDRQICCLKFVQDREQRLFARALGQMGWAKGKLKASIKATNNLEVKL
jgi:hypothetical protein